MKRALVLADCPVSQSRKWDIAGLAELLRSLWTSLQKVVKCYLAQEGSSRAFVWNDIFEKIEDLQTAREYLPAGLFNRVYLWVNDSCQRLSLDQADVYSVNQLNWLVHSLMQVRKRLTRLKKN